LKAAHRQHTHKGHCRFIHGENWTFDITFACRELDENGFVIDFGGLGLLREKLYYFFDHTLLLAASDPLVKDLNFIIFDYAQVRTLESVSAEGLAEFVFTLAEGIRAETHERVWPLKVMCYEDEKNSATYSLDSD
jgi:6-pyruvoyltetrahydropterin/6-carboxytetrahydropterin synthase